MCFAISLVALTPHIISQNIFAIITTLIILFIGFLSILLVNKHYYFKSKQWLKLRSQHNENIKISLALNQSIRYSLSKYSFDITVNCSQDTITSAKVDPIEITFQAFDIKINLKSLQFYKELEREFRIIRKEKRYLEKELGLLVKTIKTDLPFYVKIVSPDIVHYILGEKLVEYIRYPRYRFSYYVSGTGYYETYEIIMNTRMIRSFIKYIKERMYSTSSES